MEKEKRVVWEFSFIRKDYEIQASIYELTQDIIKDYVPEQLSFIRLSNGVMVSKFFDTEEEARKYYDEFTASAYAFDLDKLKELK